MPRILITGASSGIGAALARHYAGAGSSLVLVGRDAARLDAVAQACRARGAAVETARLDLRERAAARAILHAADAAEPLDLVIVNAGVNGGHPLGDVESEEAGFETADINYTGSLNVLLPVLPLMLARHRGQIVLMSSLAAYAPLQDAPAYSGAKAALVAHGLALRQKVRPRGVRINVVTPGYVKTPMGGELKGWRPFEISADRAASVIARGIARDRDVIAFPAVLAALARTVPLLPESLRRASLYAFRFQRRIRR